MGDKDIKKVGPKSDTSAESEGYNKKMGKKIAKRRLKKKQRK